MKLEELKEAKALYESLGPLYLSRETVEHLFETAIAAATVVDVLEGATVESAKPARRKKGE